jgi:glutaredoxin
MEAAVIIFGRDGCPFTRAAREAYASEGRLVEYINVRKDPQGAARLLSLSGGSPRVPVIVDGDVVTVGWQGKW